MMILWLTHNAYDKSDISIGTQQAEVLCSPSFGGFGGIPAGCQTDKSGDLWVADMRLGLLHINHSTGACQQVSEHSI